jgi:thymidylate synthase ThyX
MHKRRNKKEYKQEEIRRDDRKNIIKINRIGFRRRRMKKKKKMEFRKIWKRIKKIMKIKRKLLMKMKKRKEKRQVNPLNSVKLTLNYRTRVKSTRRRRRWDNFLRMRHKNKGKTVLRSNKINLTLKKKLTGKMKKTMTTTKIVAKLNPKAILIIGSRKSKNKKSLRFTNSSMKILWTQMKSSKN